MSSTKAHKTDWVHVRVTADQRRKIRERADECGLPVSTFVRKVAMGSIPRARPRRLEKKAVYHLGRIGNNLNQLARVANASGQVSEERHLRVITEELLAAIRRLL